MKKIIAVALLLISSTLFADQYARQDLERAQRKITNALRISKDRGLRAELLNAQIYIRNAQIRLDDSVADNYSTSRLVKDSASICTLRQVGRYAPLKPAAIAVTLELEKLCGLHCNIAISYKAAGSSCEVSGTATRL